MSDEIVIIDSRVIGFSQQPKRIIAVCDKQDGLIHLVREETFTEHAVKAENRHNTVIITDALEIVKDWQMPFHMKDLKDVINIYQMRSLAGLISFDDKLRKYDPKQVLQIRKIDKNGLEQEFDSTSLDNGHMAVLLAVWASYRIKLNIDCMTPQDDDNYDDTLLPFSVY